MVTNYVWQDLAGADEGMICLSCLESRIGRELLPNDFTSVIINLDDSMNPKSKKLMDRMRIKIGKPD